jgi:hypothetical protein
MPSLDLKSFNTRNFGRHAQLAIAGHASHDCIINSRNF